MSNLILPLVEKVIRSNLNVDLKRVVVIGVQHILETTHSMFQSLYNLGLKAENIHLIGKCYSTNKDVLAEMQDDGIDVSNLSTFYDFYESFDDVFDRNIHTFVGASLKKVKSNEIDLVIVLDDGGKCLKYLKKQRELLSYPIVGIEQTSSGYEQIRNEMLQFPVINVAKEPLKLEVESPMIAKAFCERLFAALEKNSKNINSTLVLGGGPIGQNIQHILLEKGFKSDIYDLNPKLNSLNNLVLENIIGNYDCIIGCTGRTSLNEAFIKLLKQDVILASASSSDREFDSVKLRQHLEKSEDCHANLLIESRLLLNSGFPVNFDGERENIHPFLIQLTIALIAAAIIEGANRHNSLPITFVHLSEATQKLIGQEFQKILRKKLPGCSYLDKMP